MEGKKGRGGGGKGGRGGENQKEKKQNIPAICAGSPCGACAAVDYQVTISLHHLVYKLVVHSWSSFILFCHTREKGPAPWPGVFEAHKGTPAELY